MFVIMAVATDTRAVGEAAAIAIGGTVGLDAMFGGADHRRLDEPGPLLGPGTRRRRPARDSGSTSLAPILGAAIAALAYTFVRGPEPGASRSGR